MKFLGVLGLIVGVVVVGINMDDSMAYYIMSNAMWVLVVLIMAAIIIFLISSVVKLNSHTTTNYYNVDNSSHTTTSTTTNNAWINQADPNRLGVNNSNFLTSGD